jgi:glycolate oxidase
MTPAARDRLAQTFREIVGDDGVISSPDELRVYECDALTTHHRAMPDLVVLPGGTDQVAAVVRRCANEDVPIVPRGAGTGLSAGDPQGGVLIVLTRMDRILDIDVANRRPRSRRLRNLAINRAVMPRVLLRPDPASQQASTIGGNGGECGRPSLPEVRRHDEPRRGRARRAPDGEIAAFGGRLADRPGYDLMGSSSGRKARSASARK